jgi:WG containing repeat
MDGKLGGYLASGGALHIPLTYEAGGQFPEGVAPVRLDGKWGFIDKRGAFVVKPEYDRREFALSRADGV